MFRDPEEYIERIYSTRIEKLLKEVKKEFPRRLQVLREDQENVHQNTSNRLNNIY